MFEDDEKPATDRFAAARAAKAAKAFAEAQRQSEQAEREAAPAEVAAGQPTVSSLKTRQVFIDEGKPVEMRVTPWGHAQISTGGEYGFERYARGAQFRAPEQNARSLYSKRWAEPIDPTYADRWVEMDHRDAATSARAKQMFEHRMEHGVAAGERWSADNG